MCINTHKDTQTAEGGKEAKENNKSLDILLIILPQTRQLTKTTMLWSNMYIYLKFYISINAHNLCLM